MNTKKKLQAMNRGSSNNTNLLRIGVILLSIVSFFTTANGMQDYIFINNTPIAYAASAAIQGILLALSMNLPGYLRNIFQKHSLLEKEKTDKKIEKAKHFFISLVSLLLNCAKAVIAIMLTIVTIFCSTWFSYIYIAETIHQTSWGTDSELLVQQTYRTELYNARDYAHNYRLYLEESLGEKIISIEEQTRELRDFSGDIEIKWDEERRIYVEESTTAAGSYMSSVIEAMKNALSESGNASQEARDMAATALADAEINITKRMEDIQKNLDTLNSNISNYETRVRNLQNQIRQATEDTDVSALSNAISAYTQLIESTSRQLANLQTEYLQLDAAHMRLPQYETLLGLTSSTSSISIRRELLQLQTEFFKAEPDKDKLLESANKIFQSFREASRGETGEDGLSYTSLLVQMNQLIRNLSDYSSIKGIETDLDMMIDELSKDGKEDEFVSSSESQEDTEPTESGIPAGTDDGSEGNLSSEDNSPGDSPDPSTSPEPDTAEDSETSAESEEQGVQDATAAPGESVAPTETPDSDSNAKPEEKEERSWQENWYDRLNGLKAAISAMPVYSGTERTESGTNGILSESQVNILINYNRDESGRELDDMIRRYISNHNAVYQGIIYLQSPYRSLAIFALVLALSFDLSGFIFGFVAQDNPQDEDEIPREMRNIVSEKQKASAEWSILETLNQYIVLTGDYENRDGLYYYDAFKDGVLCQWAVRDTIPYLQGIYIQEEVDTEYSKGKSLQEAGQSLLFANQTDGPQDGIYRDCQLIYDEGSLILVQGDQKSFIANVDEYVPAHSYSPERGENRTIPTKQLIKKERNDQIIVVALNTKGTRVVAIYIFE